MSIDRAFEMLRAYARNHGLRLGDVAQGVIDGSTSVAELKRQIAEPRAPQPLDTIAAALDGAAQATSGRSRNSDP